MPEQDQTPQGTQAQLQQGVRHYESGQFPQALAVFEDAAARHPPAPLLLAWLCLARLACGQLAPAAAAGEQAWQHGAGGAAIPNALGQIAVRHGEHRNAIKRFREALAIDPAFADAWHSLGVSLHHRGAFAEAAAAYGQALAHGPDSARLRYHLALAVQATGDRAAAIEQLQLALRMDAGHTEALIRLCYLQRAHCDWRHLDAMLQRIAVALPHAATAPSPYELNTIGIGQALRIPVARRYAQEVLAAATQIAQPFRHRVEAGATPRLRIAYLSPDFCNHAVGGVVHDLFRRHDRERLEVFCYSLRHRDDDLQKAIRAGADHFCDLSATPAGEAADRIHADRPHLLVDLGGYTAHTRPEIVALRPAPLQLSWLGYPDTMGADYIDYLIADRIVAPNGSEEHYSEKLIRLPHAFMPASPSLPPASVQPDGAKPGGAFITRAQAGLPEDGFVFASFNNPYKIGPACFAAWMRILSAQPGSVLWLYADAAETRANLVRECARHGVATQRLVFAARVSMSEHLARLPLADLFVDTFDYGAGATGITALQAGLPLLTLPGKDMLGRMGASFNHTLGLDELVAADEGEYCDRALALARAAGHLADIRAALCSASSAPLFDLDAFARHLETAYLTAWSRYCDGKAPAHINVATDESLQPGSDTGA